MQPLQFILLTALGWFIAGATFRVGIDDTRLSDLHTLHVAICFYVGLACYYCGRCSKR